MTTPESFVRDALAIVSTWSHTPEAAKLAGFAFGTPGDHYPAAAIGAGEDLCVKLASIPTPVALSGVAAVAQFVLVRAQIEIEGQLGPTQLSRVTIALSEFDRAVISRYCTAVRAAVERQLASSSTVGESGRE